MKLEDEISQKKFRNSYQKAMVNIIFTYTWLQEYQAKIFKPFNLTIQQFNILRILRGQHPQPATVKLLRERMLDKMSDASRIVEKLREKGLVERNICENDRRTVDVKITQAGLALLSELDKKDSEMDQIFSRLSEPEVDQLNSLLDKIRD